MVHHVPSTTCLVWILTCGMNLAFIFLFACLYNFMYTSLMIIEYCKCWISLFLQRGCSHMCRAQKCLVLVVIATYVLQYMLFPIMPS
ncbi:Os04g0607200 [Oryza sativa Japonica Group]|uniref:Os04g0607200 protein n=1 Tax=Oryza sativa subsp. japonica TaxID=39947 RepID=Q0JAB6_ORYSJ|nr:Os04g0607200 [Oryza sativa Japonica Group]|eukprot:NP_001053807.1 Os04g0607200 [Oryza sativa Japonica Group]